MPFSNFRLNSKGVYDIISSKKFGLPKLFLKPWFWGPVDTTLSTGSFGPTWTFFKSRNWDASQWLGTSGLSDWIFKIQEGIFTRTQVRIPHWIHSMIMKISNYLLPWSYGSRWCPNPPHWCQMAHITMGVHLKKKAIKKLWNQLSACCAL